MPRINAASRQARPATITNASKFVALAFAIAQRDQSLFEPRRQRLDVDLAATGETDRHIVKKDRLGAHRRNPKAGFVNDFEAEILEDRHPLRERQRGVAGVELQRGEIDGALVWRDPHSAPALDLQPFNDRDIG